jgi:hypothetical protein
MRASRIASSRSPCAHFSRMDCSKMDRGVSSSREDIGQADTTYNQGRRRVPTHPSPSCPVLYNFLGHW